MMIMLSYLGEITVSPLFIDRKPSLINPMMKLLRTKTIDIYLYYGFCYLLVFRFLAESSVYVGGVKRGVHNADDVVDDSNRE